MLGGPIIEYCPMAVNGSCRMLALLNHKFSFQSEIENLVFHPQNYVLCTDLIKAPELIRNYSGCLLCSNLLEIIGAVSFYFTEFLKGIIVYCRNAGVKLPQEWT